MQDEQTPPLPGRLIPPLSAEDYEAEVAMVRAQIERGAALARLKMSAPASQEIH